MKLTLASFLGSLLFCVGAHAADTWGGESLRGLKPFKVQLTMGACATGLTLKVVSDISRDIELKLPIARIPFDAKANLPMLAMDAECLHITVGGRLVGYAIHMRLVLDQYLLVEETKQHLAATTWETVDGWTCSTESCPDEMRTRAKNMTDEFINDFLKANENK